MPIKSPKIEGSKVESQGDVENQFLYQQSCCSRSLFHFSRLSLTLLRLSSKSPVLSTQTQHSSFKAAQSPPCCRKKRSNPLFPPGIDLKVQLDEIRNCVSSVFFCWCLWHSGESEDNDCSDVGLKEVTGVEVSIHGESLAHSAGLASTGTCKYISRASPGTTSSLDIRSLFQQRHKMFRNGLIPSPFYLFIYLFIYLYLIEY